MHHLLQNLKNGDTSIIEAPNPILIDNNLIIKTLVSLVSIGTEKMLTNFGKASYLEKAIQQPEKVKMVFDKLKNDGLLTTFESVKSKLDQPITLGYSNVGIIKEIGDGQTKFSIGQRVVSNGPHADLVRVNKNLCAAIPDNVSNNTAAFTVLASIGLQGIRLAKPSLGEKFVVIGVGLIGLLTVQLLKANGCQVLAIDPDDRKLEKAKKFGSEICNPNITDPVNFGLGFSNGNGVDGVIVCASTKSDELIAQAAKMSRKRGRIILVGVTGLKLNRDHFYEKELTFQVSCSYGPGRYDKDYEELGNDYPIGYVRWTEQRNFEAVLEMMSKGLINVDSLITDEVDFNDSPKIYNDLISDNAKLGIILNYNEKKAYQPKFTIELNTKNIYKNNNTPVFAFIGAGNYASRKLIPIFKTFKIQLDTIVTSGGLNSSIQGKKFGFKNASTDFKSIIKNESISSIVIATRHNSHAELTYESLRAGKNVFVEKPLALDQQSLKKIEDIFFVNNKIDKQPILMVGFNRRFAPQIYKIKELIQGLREPKSVIMTMNAGFLPEDHWSHDVFKGGGRIVGEACHYIDLMRYIVGHKIINFQVSKMGKNESISVTEDKAIITLNFADGSHGVINYLANGSNKFPKERIEIFSEGKILQLDNFKKLKGYGWKSFRKMNLWHQDKGQKNCIKSFISSLENGTPAIPYDELFEVANVTIEIAQNLKK